MKQITLTLDVSDDALALLLSAIMPKTAVITELPAPAPEPEKPKAVVTQSAVTLADVKALCTKLVRAKKSDALAEIFAKFGAEKLSDIAESDYPALKEALVSVNA